MNAYICEKYGTFESLKLCELEKPIPNENQILIKIKSVSINKADLYVIKGSPFPVRFIIGGVFNPPKNFIPISDISGVVEQCGKNIRDFVAGDEVFADISSCGYGGLAEYVLVPEEYLVKKPDNISFEQAAATPMACVTALNIFEELTNINTNSKILINGASGGVGTFVLQMAKNYSNDVTAICSTRKIEYVKKLGINKIIDYNKQNFRSIQEKYDLIIAVNGNQSIFDYYKLLNNDAMYIMSGGANRQMIQALTLGKIISLFSNKKIKTILSMPKKEKLTKIKSMIESGEIVPQVSKVFSLHQVHEAFRYFNSGEACGKVIININ